MRAIGRIVRRIGRGAWLLPTGLVGMFLLAGCEMAGGNSDDTLIELPGTFAGVKHPNIEESEDAQPAPVVAPGVEVSESVAFAIRDAAVTYVREESAIRDIQVEIDAVADGWARARTIPMRDETDPATLYLRQEGSGWRGISLGTAFLPEDLEEMGVPPSVRQ